MLVMIWIQGDQYYIQNIDLVYIYKVKSSKKIYFLYFILKVGGELFRKLIGKGVFQWKVIEVAVVSNIKNITS